MTAKLPTSTTDEQDAFGTKIEAEAVATEALRGLLQRRFDGQMISATEMGSRVEAMIERKRRVLYDRCLLWGRKRTVSDQPHEH